MGKTDQRQSPREDLILEASLCYDGQAEFFPIKVRNLSSSGLMAEGGIPLARGARVSITLNGLQSWLGEVMWIQGHRFGVSFVTPLP